MSYEVLSTSPTFGYYVREPVEFLQRHGCEVELVPQGRELSEQKLSELVINFDGIIVGTEKITERVIGTGGRLKVIAKHGAGTDNIDMASAAKRGIAVVSAPGANSDAVADLTMGLLLGVARDVVRADRAVREGNWPRVVGVQLTNKVLGIIGLGQIGKRVAKRAIGFGMRVVAYDILPDHTFAQQFGLSYLPLDSLLTESDFVSVNVSLNAATKQLIGKRELGLMKGDATLISISRGEVIDEEALYHALKEKKIRAAALDVFTIEPLKDSPLTELDNVIVTPHMGGYTFEALRETGMTCARGIVAALQGTQT